MITKDSLRNIIKGTGGGFINNKILSEDYIASYRENNVIIEFYIDKIIYNGTIINLEEILKIKIVANDKSTSRGDGIEILCCERILFIPVEGVNSHYKDVYGLHTLINKIIHNYKVELRELR